MLIREVGLGVAMSNTKNGQWNEKKKRFSVSPRQRVCVMMDGLD